MNTITVIYRLKNGREWYKYLFLWWWPSIYKETNTKNTVVQESSRKNIYEKTLEKRLKKINQMKLKGRPSIGGSSHQSFRKGQDGWFQIT